MIFASFYGFPVVEHARVQYVYVRLGSLCIKIYYVGLPVRVPQEAPAAMYILKQGVKLMAYHGLMCAAFQWCTFP